MSKTPKDLAKDLVDQFIPLVRVKMGQEDYLQRAKKCAIIATDKLIEYAKLHGFVALTDYYIEVKKEITNL